MTEVPPASRPWTLWWAVAIVIVQVIVLAGLTGLLVYLDLTRGVTTARIALSVTGYSVVMTLLFALVATGLARRARWARGPAIVLEMLQVPIGYNMVTDGGALIGLPMMVLGVAGAVLLLAPATRLALGIR